MAEKRRIDLKDAVNAISDVVQNRPRPLRDFDQIHMKSGDMVMQSEFIARWADGKRLAFVGDGDAISVCVVYLRARGILPYGPEHVTVFDFAVAGLLLLWALAYRRLRYVLTDTALRIDWLGQTTVVPYAVWLYSQAAAVRSMPRQPCELGTPKATPLLVPPSSSGESSRGSIWPSSSTSSDVCIMTLGRVQ